MFVTFAKNSPFGCFAPKDWTLFYRTILGDNHSGADRILTASRLVTEWVRA